MRKNEKICEKCNGEMYKYKSFYRLMIHYKCRKCGSILVDFEGAKYKQTSVDETIDLVDTKDKNLYDIQSILAEVESKIK